MVMEAGKVTSEELPLVRDTVAPPNWAGILRVIVPPVGKPPSTAFAVTVERLTTGVTARLTPFRTEPSVAYNFTVTGACRAEPPTTKEKLPVLCPSAMFTGNGVGIRVESVARNEMDTPPAGAAAASETVPCTKAPGATFEELSDKEARADGLAAPG